MDDYPFNAKNIPIGQKRKGERRLVSQSCYLRQPLEKFVQRKEFATDKSSSTLSPPLKKKGQNDILPSTSEMFCQAQMKLALRVYCENHTVLCWLRKMDIIEKKM